MQQTRLNRRWLIKVGVFFIALAGLGAWGLWDALVAYPERGRNHAEWVEKEYLAAAEAEGRLLRASVSNPREELRRLRERGDDLTALEEARLEWLTSLDRVGDLPASEANEDSPTVFDNARARLESLRDEWATKSPPKPLGAFDIPLQWVIVALGFGGALWTLGVIGRASRFRFGYEPEENALTLSDGRRLTPDQLNEVDKRKWDKFYVTLRLKDGSAVKLDLLRYIPLEQWVLEMEQAAGLAEASESETATQARSEQTGGGSDSSESTEPTSGAEASKSGGES